MKTDLRKKIESQIGEAIGYASLCWEPKPTGVFDSTAAGKAMDHAMRHVDALLDVVEAASKIKHASWCDSTKDIGCGCDCRVEELSKALERLEAINDRPTKSLVSLEE